MNPVAEVLSRLQNVKEHNGYFMAVCPSHPDNNPSLSISEGDDGRALIKCFAGCAAKDIVEAIGLNMSDLFVEGGEGGVIPLRNTTSLHHPLKRRITTPKEVMRRCTTSQRAPLL